MHDILRLRDTGDTVCCWEQPIDYFFPWLPMAGAVGLMRLCYKLLVASILIKVGEGWGNYLDMFRKHLWFQGLAVLDMWTPPIHVSIPTILSQNEQFIPSRVSGRGYKIGPVCPSVCVCLLVSSLTAEPFGLGPQNLVLRMSLVISQPSSKVKVIGQRSRSPHWKTRFLDDVMCVDCADPCWHDIWHHVMSQRDVMTSHDVMAWRNVVIWRLKGQNIDKEGMSREGASTLRRFHLIIETLWFWNGTFIFYVNLLSKGCLVLRQDWFNRPPYDNCLTRHWHYNTIM